MQKHEKSCIITKTPTPWIFYKVPFGEVFLGTMTNVEPHISEKLGPTEENTYVSQILVKFPERYRSMISIFSRFYELHWDTFFSIFFEG